MRRAAALLVFTAVACGPLPSPTPTAALPPTTTLATGAPSTSTPAHENIEVYLSSFSEMGPGWTELFFPYGFGEGFLGRSGAGIDRFVGPAYGTQSQDGRWWFLDTANRRIARFSEQGDYLNELILPAALLINEELFDFQMPHALDHGAIVAFGVRGGGTSILTVTDDQAYESLIASDVVWEVTDGRFVYGSTPEGLRERLATWEGTVSTIDWYVARNQSRYRTTIDGDVLNLELPDAGVTRSITMRFAEQPELRLNFEIQVDTGADGTLFLLVYGAPLSDPDLKVGVLIEMAPDGSVVRSQPIVDLFSETDPGSPAHLGVRPGTSSPWVMVVGDDGVHVYIREN